MSKSSSLYNHNCYVIFTGLTLLLKTFLIPYLMLCLLSKPFQLNHLLTYEKVEVVVKPFNKGIFLVRKQGYLVRSRNLPSQARDARLFVECCSLSTVYDQLSCSFPFALQVLASRKLKELLTAASKTFTTSTAFQIDEIGSVPLNSKRSFSFMYFIWFMLEIR